MGILAATPGLGGFNASCLIGTLAEHYLIGPLHFQHRLMQSYRLVPLEACCEPIAVQCHAQMLEIPRELVFAFALKWPQRLAEWSVVLGPPLFPAPVRPVHTVQIVRGPNADSGDKAATEGRAVS